MVEPSQKCPGCRPCGLEAEADDRAMPRPTCQCEMGFLEDRIEGAARPLDGDLQLNRHGLAMTSHKGSQRDFAAWQQ
jgi:hypothetical protein